MTELSEINEGDTVTVRGTVKRSVNGVGLLVELYSKTDQYDAWVRADLVVEHTPKPPIPPEPEPGAYDIGGVLCVRWAGDETNRAWAVATTGVVGGFEWEDWAGTWALLGGPDVTITRLVAIPEVELPWKFGGVEVQPTTPDAESVYVSTKGCSYGFAHLHPDAAEQMAYAILAAAHAARSKP